MSTWMVLAKGPVFRFALAFLILGLARAFLISALGMIQALQHAGDHRIPYRNIMGDTVKWLFPLFRLHRTQRFYSYASFVFHVGILLTFFFLKSHLEIFTAGAGFPGLRMFWLTLDKQILDRFAILALIAGFYLLAHRVYAQSSRMLSGFMDYILLLLLIGLFASGFLAGQSWNPIAYDGLMLFHTLSGILITILIPFTKIAHCILYPLVRLGSEIGWRFTPKGGSEVINVLYGPEGRKI